MSQMAPYSLKSALLLNRALWALVSSVLRKEIGSHFGCRLCVFMSFCMSTVPNQDSSNSVARDTGHPSLSLYLCWPIEEGFQNLVLCPSTTQLIQITSSSSSYDYLNQLCSAREEEKKSAPRGAPGPSLGNTAIENRLCAHGCLSAVLLLPLKSLWSHFVCVVRGRERCVEVWTQRSSKARLARGGWGARPGRATQL